MTHERVPAGTGGHTMLLCVCTFILLAAITRQESQLDSTQSCSRQVSIQGGTVLLSDGYRQGSLLTYSCPDGTYPYPVQSRMCQSDGNWSPMRSPSGRRMTQASCRDMRCPPQQVFENGFFGPRLSAHRVGSVLNFECFDGYQLHGSAQRHCQPNGRWNGTSPVCDDGAGHCQSLPIPPGALSSGGRNRLGDRVSFQCMKGLDLVGSSQHVCTPEGEWSGAETSCRAPYSYDRAEDVGAEFGASLTNVLSVASSGSDHTQGQSLGRRLILSQDSYLHVYLLADASHSVTKENFEIFKNSLEIIIDRIASFEVPVRFAVFSYASKPKKIVDTFDDIAEDADLVIEKMKDKMKYEDHGNATGTNIQEALKAVYHMMLNHRAFNDKHWDTIRHAIILLTDGKSNMGGSPTNATRSIEGLLDVARNRKDYLDIYVFGVGNLDVDWEAMNEVASKKAGERHVFILKDPVELKKAFEDVLDPRDLKDLCGMANSSASARWDHQQPWHVMLQHNTQREPSCRGALISKTWVLTAAHCFSKFNYTPEWNVILADKTADRAAFQIKRRIDHDLYNVRAKAAQGINEFYDYDISLLELDVPAQVAEKLRPICLPCTTGANKALKKPEAATCKDHELDLLSFEKVPAQFISLDNERLNVLIKTKKSRPKCISAAVQHELYSKVTNVSEVVTDRFLCSGADGNGVVEDASCKGESGGSLFVERRARYFQVGVISWGTFDPCEKKGKSAASEHRAREIPKRGQKPRDFYISLFRVQDWLRRHLAGSLRFIPQQLALWSEPKSFTSYQSCSSYNRDGTCQPGETKGQLTGEPEMQLRCQLFYILLALGAFFTGATDGACDPQKAAIAGGNYTWLEEGIIIKYHCPDGKYPHPTEIRTCHGSRWELMRDAQQRPVRKAECRDIRCTRPLEFENGLYEPRQPYYNISQELRFECYQGYMLRGSQNRTCLPHGKWSGQTTVCDDKAGHCLNPGIPIGARKEGRRYRIEDRVRYHCDNGLALMGSQYRVCQESRAWTGTEPECRSPFTYDTPKEVSSQFISSLTEVAESSDPDKVVSDTEQRKIRITPGGSMNIYIVLDASQSVGKKNFDEAKDVINKLIEKVSSYDITPNYGVITFATQPKVIVSTADQHSSNAAWVIDQLEKLRHEDHSLQPGTNIKAGLTSVYEMMSNQQEDELRRHLNPLPIITTTRHVILLLTDGNYNMGGDPTPVIGQIREFLNIGRERVEHREDYLDVYVFGIGEMVRIEKVNEWASKKTGEKHVFKLENLEAMQKVFDEMIDEIEALSMCGLAKEYNSADDEEKNPWLVSISILRPGRGTEMCKGTLISEKCVLTAAHCFTIDDTADDIKVKIGEKMFHAAALKSHPQYTVGKLRNLGIPEFYDYDVALLTLQEKVTFSSKARPICLPCTAGTTRALRRPHPQTTCMDHEEELMSIGDIPAFFVTPCRDMSTPVPGLRRRTVRIKSSDKKQSCEADAKKAKQYQNVTDVSQVVTERFLCTGGIEPQVDPNTCKGDSGGPLIISKRLRYIQVGVISWGVVDVCKTREQTDCKRDLLERAPSHARDFHINLFKVLPWLRQELREEGLDFLN
ncbi:uncharacterized protein LOC132571914 [Heteronotia binoei]|uniref:uncharacterized protein LOC132571914 n=1 Tax=Heteronotia binoei TaxID=13085 RepID=UPI00292EA385|nr:uncharacterized protein LOC132571914 [Heteronotia binoei]